MGEGAGEGWCGRPELLPLPLRRCWGVGREDCGLSLDPSIIRDLLLGEGGWRENGDAGFPVLGLQQQVAATWPVEA